MSGYRYWSDRIAALDPVHDHEEIYRISAGHEFPWDYTRALEFALFRTYCVPSVSALLDATREFRDRPQRRYDDTALLMAEIAAHGYDSPRGKEALRVINRMHGRYAISNDDMLYVLSTFIYDPIVWLDRYGWRPLAEAEQLAAFHYYREVGHRMGIREIPSSFGEFRAFKASYETSKFVYSDTNRRVGEYTVGLFAAWFPRPLRPLARLGVRSMLDPLMLTAFGFRAAPRWVTAVGEGTLRMRARFLGLGRRMGAIRPRMISRLGQEAKNRTYPGYPTGYRPGDLGAPEPPADLDTRWLRPRSGA
jgi:hypothetical protein